MTRAGLTTNLTRLRVAKGPTVQYRAPLAVSIEEGQAIVAALPAGVGRLEVIAGAGHYPHVQFPQEVIALMRSLLSEVHA